MVNRLFGNYLVKKDFLSDDKLDGLFPLDKEKKADITTIAVLKKMLSASEVTTIISELDTVDQHFGEFVVTNNILLDRDVDKLFSYQNNKFYMFIQQLIDDNIIELENINFLIDDFQKDSEFSQEVMDSLIADDVEEIIKLLIPCEDEHVNKMILTIMMTFRRLIDANVYFDKGYSDSSVSLDAYSAQLLSGDFNIKLYFTGDNDSLLGIANYFTAAKYDTVSEDALDNIGEFINCINGQMATDLSYEDIDIDMGAPEYSLNGCSINGGIYYVLPMHANGYSFRAVIDVTL